MRTTLALAAMLCASAAQAATPGSVGLTPACQAATQHIPAVCGRPGGHAAGFTAAQSLCYQREAAKAQQVCGMKDGRIVDRSKLGATIPPDLHYNSNRHH